MLTVLVYSLVDGGLIDLLKGFFDFFTITVP